MKKLNFKSNNLALTIIIIIGFTIFMSSTSLRQYALADAGGCEDAQAGSVLGSNNLVTYNAPSGQYIYSVCVKASVEHYTFISDGSNGCYTVSGIGTGSVTVTRTGSQDSSCQEISHVDVYYGSSLPTATPTPTNNPTDSPTATPTSTATPTNNPTNSPTATPTPTPTSGGGSGPLAESPTSTPTPTPYQEETPTATPTVYQGENTPTPTPTSIQSNVGGTQENPTATPTPTSSANSNSSSTSSTNSSSNSPTATPTVTPRVIASVSSQGQVLGASTARSNKKLPETGSATYWVIALLMLLTSGIASTIKGISTLKKNPSYN